MSLLKLNAVDKVFPSGELALYDINFEAGEKELIAVVGGEKSGKSTLLRVIAGLEECNSGKIEIDGKDVTDAAPKDRELAMIFRSSTLYPSLTVYDNMAYGLRIRKAPQALVDQRVKSAAKILGLEPVLYRKPKALTAAQRQRVAIGRAIVREPKLYLFDEPLAGLDEKLKNDMLALIVNLQARMNGTFLYATKNVNEALSVGTRVIILKNGIIQQIDTPANLYDYPANAYVAFTVGSPTINFVNGCTVVEEDGKVFVNGGIKLPLPESVKARFTDCAAYVAEGKTVNVGVRPEDARIAEDGDIPAKVTATENDGEEYYAECETQTGATLVVKASPQNKKGDGVLLKIDAERLQLFDSESRLTLLARDGGYVKTPYADADVAPLDYRDELEILEKAKPKKDNKKKRR